MAEFFTRLLLATEHSEYDTGAEAVSLAMAQRCQLPLSVVLPLVSNPEYEALAPQIAARAEQDAAAKVDKLQAQADAVGVAMTLHVRRGAEPYREIVNEAREQASELIIIRRRGKRGFLANLLVGEMVSKVVAHAPCHILIVPRGARMWRQRVLAAAEPTAQGRQVVVAALAVAAQCALPLHLLSVVAADGSRALADTFIGEMLALARRESVAAHGEVRSGKPFTEILAAAVASQSDLIVMGSHGGHGIGRALVGGVAQKVIGLSECPALVLHH